MTVKNTFVEFSAGRFNIPAQTVPLNAVLNSRRFKTR